MKRFLIPIVLFIVLIGFLAVGLKRDPRDVPSPLVGKPAPAFSLPMLVGGQSLSPQDMRGKVWLFNVWASWCVSCRDEHPVLVKFVKSGKMPEILIVGLNYKDQTDDAKAWLARFGNPYTLSLVDADGRASRVVAVAGSPQPRSSLTHPKNRAMTSRGPSLSSSNATTRATAVTSSGCITQQRVTSSNPLCRMAQQ